MFYIKEAVDGVWKTFKLSDLEVEKLQRVTAKRVMKAIATVRAEVTKAAESTPPVTYTPAEILVIVQKVAPTYDDTVRDWLRKQSWKGTAAPAAPAAPAETAAAK